MKLSEQADLELELLKQQISFYKFSNGILASVIVGGIAYAIYKVVGVFL